MNLSTTIETNKKIMALIKSKYPSDFPLAYHNRESQYYRLLENDLVEAERSLSYTTEK